MEVALHRSAVFLMGPTAAGKSAAALALCDRFPFEVISVDAAQVYRGMDIGTAKPTAAERARVRHRLIDICDPTEVYSAARFRVDALREMEHIAALGRVPLLTGGTMFYFHALEHGLDPLPPAAPALRARLRGQAAREGWPALHRRLAALDPAAAARIHPHDGQRIERALEICDAPGGRDRARLQGRSAPPPGWRFVSLILAPGNRADLHRRIGRRLASMLAAGLVAEVQGLLARGGLSGELPALRAVGYRQVGQYLSNALGYNAMVEAVLAATRQLAKRQLTWLRARRGAVWFDSSHPATAKAVGEFVAALGL